MVVSGNWLIARQIVSTTLYILVRLLFITVQRIYWHLNGTACKLREARLPHNYKQSAHVLDVVYFHEFCPVQIVTIDSFLYTHNRFEDPQYIIDNDDISLMTINEHDAVFCEPTERGMHLWRSKYASFIYVAHKTFCRRLIVVPLSTFHRLADTVGDPVGQLTFLFNVMRSGTTLLSRIMEYTERCVSISEPSSITAVVVKYRQCGDTPDIRRLACDVVRWECRPYMTLQPPPLGYFVKLMSQCIDVLPLFRELFPTSRCLFMYRDVNKVAVSCYRASFVVPRFNVLLKLSKLSAYFTKMILDAFGCSRSECCVRLDNDLMAGVLLSAGITSVYLSAYRRGLNVNAIRYEDVISHPLDMCHVLLDYCNYPVSLSERAVKAFDFDSQSNCILARSIIGQFRDPEMTPDIEAKLNKVLKRNGMALIGEPGILEGSLRPTCL